LRAASKTASTSGISSNIVSNVWGWGLTVINDKNVQ